MCVFQRLIHLFARLYSSKNEFTPPNGSNPVKLPGISPLEAFGAGAAAVLDWSPVSSVFCFPPPAEQYSISSRMTTMALFFSCVVLSSQTSSSSRPRMLMNELSLSCIFLMRSQTGPKAFTERFTHRVLFSALVSYTFLPIRNRTLSPFSENLRAGAPSYPWK